MGYSYCEKHDQESTNGCEGCTREAQELCPHARVTCNDCGKVIARLDDASMPEGSSDVPMAAFGAVIDALEPLNAAQRLRVVRACAVLLDIELRAYASGS